MSLMLDIDYKLKPNKLHMIELTGDPKEEGQQDLARVQST